MMRRKTASAVPAGLLLLALAAAPAWAGHEPDHTAASFQPKAGNEWWVETDVTADEPLAGVDARADDGAWVALDRQDWGSWAKSFHVASGSVVEFRATSTDGDMVVRGGNVWPSAEPADGGGDDPPDTTDIAFGPKAGNEWWVETYVVAETPPDRVRARADGGAWHELSLRPWGAWAGSFHVPAGSVVEFHATSAAGTDTSDGFVWPQADVVGGDGAWPHEGSYLRYKTHASDPAPSTTAGHLTAVRHGGTWWVFNRETREDPGGASASESFCTGDHTPSGPTGVSVGDRVDVQVGICHEGFHHVIVRERGTHDAHKDGDPVTVGTWYADRTDPCDCLRWEAEWDVGTGLVVAHDRAGRGSVGAELVDTDADID